LPKQAKKKPREEGRMTNDPNDWMWSRAVAMLDQAEQMHRQMFVPGRRAQIAWQPPVDVLETDREVLVLAALPGVDPKQVHAAIEGATLVISGQRILPRELATAHIHRLELPQGRFERRVALPPGRYDGVHRAEAHGCLVISLSKAP
jgi:HSP20 family protein